MFQFGFGIEQSKTTKNEKESLNILQAGASMFSKEEKYLGRKRLKAAYKHGNKQKWTRLFQKQPNKHIQQSWGPK